MTQNLLIINCKLNKKVNRKMEISLTRLLKEISSLQEKIANFPIIAAVGSNKTGRVDSEHCTVDEFKGTSQSRFDSWYDLQQKLITYKAARNKANVLTEVTVGGVKMSMDTAIAKKALLPVLQSALVSMKQQITKVDAVVTKSENDAQAAVDKQVTAVGSSSSASPVTAEQIKVFEDMYSKSLGKSLVIGDNIKTKLVELEKFIADFTDEIDYVLSEANANTKVTV